MASRILNPFPALRHEERLKMTALVQLFQCTDPRIIREALDETGYDFHRALDLLLSIVCAPHAEPMDLCAGSTKPPMRSLFQQHEAFDDARQRAQAGSAPRRKSLDWIEGPSSFPELPWELFVEIMTFLPKRELCALRLLNTSWRDLVDHDQVWKDKLLHAYGLRDCDPALFLRWKDRFIDADRLRWSTSRQCPKLALDNGSKTARDLCKGDEKFRWVTAVTDNVFAAGRHYVEILVDQCCDNSKNTIKIGFGCVDDVSDARLIYNCPFAYSHGSYSSEDRNGYVYLADGRIMSRNKAAPFTGNSWSKNDRIGVLMDFFQETVSFYWNSRRQGRPLPLAGCSSLHVAVSLIGNNQITLTNSSIHSVSRY